MKNPIAKNFYNMLSKELKEEADKRLTICKNCDRLDHEEMKCKECGCFMEFKTLIPRISCPIGKW